jgi:nuclear transport factor 2 (NTF2) superfamily protein
MFDTAIRFDGRVAVVTEAGLIEDRKFHWPLGRRPDEHPELSSFGF